MTKPIVPRPNVINGLRYAADSAFAMMAGMQLDLFTPLKNGPMTPEEIAEAIGVKSTRLHLLLYVLVVAGLLTEHKGKFANTAEADQFLVRGAPSYLGNRHPSWAMRWNAYFKTTESIRTGAPQAKLDFASAEPENVESFLRNINASTIPAARALLEIDDFRSVDTLVDVGSGVGGVAITIAKACPHIRATAIDLPQVTPIAEKVVAEESAADRVSVAAVDVVNEPLPGRYDVAILRAFVQVLSEDEARAALKHVGAAITPGGKMYIIGQILDDSYKSPLEAVGFNLTFLNLFEAGESYSEQKYREWLTDAGFTDIERSSVLLAEGSGLITARKSSNA